MTSRTQLELANSFPENAMAAPVMRGEICVVTGATSGIGRATAIGLAKSGARVVIVARNASKAAEVVAEIASLPGATKAEVVLADLTEMREVGRAADEIGGASTASMSWSTMRRECSTPITS